MAATATRADAIASAAHWFDAGGLLADLKRRVVVPTESQNPERSETLTRYLSEEIAPSLERLGFRWTIWENPIADAPPMLFAERIEDSTRPTVLVYGHGDVVLGYDDQWSDRRSPWELSVSEGRWYGRGTADNKGQHSSPAAIIEPLCRRSVGISMLAALPWSP